MKRILTRKEVCSGCRACEVACVARHDGQFGTATARIKVTKIEPVGLDIPNACRLCRWPACVAACPTEALYRDEVMGVGMGRGNRAADPGQAGGIGAERRS